MLIACGTKHIHFFTETKSNQCCDLLASIGWKTLTFPGHHASTNAETCPLIRALHIAHRSKTSSLTSGAITSFKAVLALASPVVVAPPVP